MAEAGDWGTLGKPDANPGGGKLLYVGQTTAAIIRYAAYEAGAKVPSHQHDCGTLVYGVGGPCIERVERGNAEKRRLTFHPSGFEHSLQFSGPTKVLVFEILHQNRADWRRECWPGSSVALPATFYDTIWQLILTIQNRVGGATADILVEGLFGSVLEYTRGLPPAWLLEVLSCIHRDWNTIPSVRELSSRFSISPQHLCRSFKRHLGITVRQYAVLLRIDYARSFLWGGHMSIADAAAAAGFADQSHLTRTLSAGVGWTPARFQRLGARLSPPTIFC